MSASPKNLELTGENFEQEVIRSDRPVLVDFSAAWCGPCQVMAPIVDHLAEDLEGRVKVGTVDIDRDQELSATYAVDAVPTFLVFKNGEVVERLVGATPRPVLEAKLEGVVAA